MKGPETEKAHERRVKEGFFDRYMAGRGLDIGYRGSNKNAEPVLSKAIGVDLGYPGYDGVKLPFPDESQDYVYSSHCLEHITDHKTSLREWFRVVKVGGHLVVAVPHQFLYEKKLRLPSHWNTDHKRFYTPGRLLIELEEALEPNTYRLVFCRDNADGFDYSFPPNKHSCGEYQVEAVLKKIVKPGWNLT